MFDRDRAREMGGPSGMLAGHKPDGITPGVMRGAAVA